MRRFQLSFGVAERVSVEIQRERELIEHVRLPGDGDAGLERAPRPLHITELERGAREHSQRARMERSRNV